MHKSIKKWLLFAAGVSLTLGSIYSAHRWKSNEPLLSIRRVEKLGRMEFSPDGKTLAVCTDQGVLLYQAGTWKQNGFLAGHTDCAVWLPDSRTLMTFGSIFAGLGTKPNHEAAEMERWDTLSGKQISRHFVQDYSVGNYSYISEALLSPDAKMAVLEGPEGMRIVSAADGRQIPHSPAASAFEPQFSSDGRYFAAASSGPNLEPTPIHVWNVNNWRNVPFENGQKIFATCLRFSPDSKILATGTPKKITLWDTSTWHVIRTFPAHFKFLFRLRFSSDGTRLAGGGRFEGNDNEFFWTLWNPVDGHEAANIHSAYFWGFMRHSRAAMTADDGTVLWDEVSGRQLWSSVDHIRWDDMYRMKAPYSETFLTDSPDGKTLVSATTFSEASELKKTKGENPIGLLQVWKMPH